MSDLDTKNNVPQSPFERIKLVDEEGNEFWSARDFMTVLKYGYWQRFATVIMKAKIACESSGYVAKHHFSTASKMVVIGSDAKREVEDFHLSRYACYLVVQNSDPSKPTVAAGQTYFAIQTHRQELADEVSFAKLGETQQRLKLRHDLTERNRDLATTAKKAGVLTSREFSVFQNFGYRGLYNGLTAQEIHRRKNLKKGQEILDHMGSTELATNLIPQHTSAR